MKIRYTLISIFTLLIITVAKSQEIFPWTYTQEMFGNSDITTDKDGVSWDNGILVSAGGGFASSSVVVRIPEGSTHLTISASSGDLKYSTAKANKTFSSTSSLSNNANINISLPEDVVYIKFQITGSLFNGKSGTIKSIIANASKWNVSPLEIDFSEVFFGHKYTSPISITKNGTNDRINTPIVDIKNSLLSDTITGNVSGRSIQLSYFVQEWKTLEDSITIKNANVENFVVKVKAAYPQLRTPSPHTPSNVIFDRFTLTWNAIPGTTEYLVTVLPTTEDPNFPVDQFTNILVNDTTKLIEGLNPDTEYSYQVTAKNSVVSILSIPSTLQTIRTAVPFPLLEMENITETDFGEICTDSISEIHKLTFSALYLQDSVIITTNRFELSFDKENWSHNLAIPFDPINFSGKEIFIRWNAYSEAGTYNDTIVIASTDADSLQIPLVIKTISPVITSNETTYSFDFNYNPDSIRTIQIPFHTENLRGDIALMVSEEANTPFFMEKTTILKDELSENNGVATIKFQSSVNDTLKTTLYIWDNLYLKDTLKVGIQILTHFNAPRNLTTNNIHCEQAEFKWDTIEAASSYKVMLYEKDTNGAYKSVTAKDTITSEINELLCSGLTYKTDYAYTVMAYRNGYLGNMSDTCYFTTKEPSLITESSSLQAFETEYGSPSSSQKITFKTEYFVEQLKIVSNNGFQISKNDTIFSDTIVFSTEELKKAENTLYCRLNSIYVRQHEGSLVWSSRLIDAQTINLSGDVKKAALTLITNPEVKTTLYFGATLKDAEISGGSVQDIYGNEIEGHFGWILPGSTILPIGSVSMPVYFSPKNAYAYQSFESLIDVTTNRAQQTIIWDQEIAEITQGDSLLLTAYSTSDLPISYVVSDTTVATVKENYFVANKGGMTTLYAHQSGDQWYMPAEGIALYVDVVNPLSVKNTSKIHVTLSPNPVVDRVEVKAESIQSITIYTIDGVILLQKENLSGNIVTLSLDQLPKGIYLMKVKQIDAESTKQFIKR